MNFSNLSAYVPLSTATPIISRCRSSCRRRKRKRTDELETVNDASALWKRPKRDISDDEYKAFYKHVAHDFGEPLAWTHNQVEGTQAYTTLLYIPKHAPFDLWDKDRQHGIKLYVRRVFIMDDAEHLMPHYLRFVRGLVDSDDLPLNVSREILQKNRFIDAIRAASVKKILGLLETMAKDEPEKYAEFWGEFGRVIKEGPAEDFANRERIAKLLRFASTHGENAEQTVSLADYVSRMQEGQQNIFYVTADSHAAAKNSPHLEIFRKKGIEVLLLSDRVDEWLTSHLKEFDGKQLVSVAKGELDLGKLGDAAEQEADKQADAGTQAPARARAENACRRGQGSAGQPPVDRFTVLPGAGKRGNGGTPAENSQTGRSRDPGQQADPGAEPEHPLVRHLNAKATTTGSATGQNCCSSRRYSARVASSRSRDFRQTYEQHAGPTCMIN